MGVEGRLLASTAGNLFHSLILADMHRRIHSGGRTAASGLTAWMDVWMDQETTF